MVIKSDTYNAPRWVCQSGQIVLLMPDGNVKRVSASNIIGAEFKGRMSIDGYVILKRPSEELSNLTFHRFPLNVRILVQRPREDSMALCWIEVFDADYAFNLHDLPADQFVINDAWFPLVSEDINTVTEAMAAASVQQLGTISLRQYLDLVRQGLHQVVVADDAIFLEQPQRAIKEHFSATAFRGHLYPYQEIGVHWLRAILSEGLGCILADEMGLGKTIQIIVVLIAEVEASRRPSLIVSPATLIENWRRELAKFAPSLDVAVHRGQDRTGFPSRLGAHDVALTSYETAVRDLSMFKMVAWNLVILDEAQAIKNPGTIRASSVKMIPRRVGIAVTGTPVENRLRDLWSLMDFACPDLLDDQAGFEERYSDYVGDAAALEPIVSPLMLRRSVSEVAADLPERIDIPQPVELSDTAVMEYNKIRLEIFQKYGKSANLVALTKLRMFCAHPFLLTGEQGDPAFFSTKYERLLELLDEIVTVGHKVIIFTSFTGMTDIFMADLSRRYHAHCDWIDGRTEVEQRQRIVDVFQDAPMAAILVLNPKAAGTGLNITAANHVIHYNLEWNPAVEDQATARAYRRGQDHPVTVHRIFHPGTVEEVIDERVARKRLLAETAVVGTQGEMEDRVDIARALELSPAVTKGRGDD